MKTKLHIIIATALAVFIAPLSAEISTREAAIDRANYDWSSQAAEDRSDSIMASDSISSWDLRYVALQRSNGDVFFTSHRIDATAFEAYWSSSEASEILNHIYSEGIDGYPVSLINYLVRFQMQDPKAEAVIRDLISNGRPSEWSKILLVQIDNEEFQNIAGTGLSSSLWRRVFMDYASTLPTGDAINLLEKEKRGLIFTPQRTSEQDRWLTDVSASIMALRLDQ